MASMTDPAARDIPEDEDVAVGWSIQQVVAVSGLGRQRLPRDEGCAGRHILHKSRPARRLVSRYVRRDVALFGGHVNSRRGGG